MDAMSPRSDSAVLLAVVVLLGALAPAVVGATSGSATELTIDVAQNGSDVAVAVTSNGTAVENASVTVTALDNSSYAGEGTYTTDANGTVGLSAPGHNVTVEVTATTENASGSTTADLLAVETEREFDSFGQRVSWFVHSLLGDDHSDGLGQLVSDFVRSHNHGADKRPDHAGPNAHSSKNTSAERGDHGPSDDHQNDGAHAGNSGNGTEKTGSETDD